jgi:hypothetical protein
MALKNYTTKVPANRSVQEIQEMLQKHGASGTLLEYEKGSGRIASIAFKIDFEGRPMGFRLPLKWREAALVMEQQGIKRAAFDEDYAYRVAWRILRDWVDVQMALVELDMARLEEIFLPYVVQQNGQTLFENIAMNPDRLLGSGENN